MWLLTSLALGLDPEVEAGDNRRGTALLLTATFTVYLLCINEVELVFYAVRS